MLGDHFVLSGVKKKSSFGGRLEGDVGANSMGSPLTGV